MTELTEQAFAIFQEELERNAAQQLQRWEEYVSKHGIATKEHAGKHMIAWMVPADVIKYIHVETGDFPVGSEIVPEHERHITIKYLGDVENSDIERVTEALAQISKKFKPFSLLITGEVKRFERVEDGSVDALYAAVQSEALQLLRSKIDALIGDLRPDDHPTYTPHITLAYVPTGATVEATVTQVSVSVKKIALTVGSSFTTFPLTGEDSVRVVLKGGPGSGHHGHAGRPGKVGGSLPGAGGGSGDAKGNTSDDDEEDDTPAGAPDTILEEGAIATYGNNTGKITKMHYSEHSEDYLVTIHDEDGNLLVKNGLASKVRLEAPASLDESKVKGALSKQFPNASDAEIDQRWAAYEKAGPTPMYHGTGEEAAYAILEQGLRGRPGEENIWGQEDDRPAAVYFTWSKGGAQTYGEGHVGKRGDRYAVIEISIPDDANPEVQFDQFEYEGWGSESSFLIEGDVPPEWISKVEIYEYGGAVDKLVETIRP